jgi:hypothetical protein
MSEGKDDEILAYAGAAIAARWRARQIVAEAAAEADANA